jgi:hypothetical protein
VRVEIVRDDDCAVEAGESLSVYKAVADDRYIVR